MKFLPCFCFKRNRGIYNISSRRVSFTNSNSIIPTVTSAPLPWSSDIPIKSDYENIIDSSDDGKIGINNKQRASKTSMECDGYTKITPIRSSQQSFNDDTELYATIDITRKAKNPTSIKTDALNTADAALSQGSLSASITASSPQPIFSSSSHRSDFTVVSEHPSLPRPIYTDITVNPTTYNHDDSSSRHHPHYKNVRSRESLQYLVQSSKMEEESN